MSKRRSFSAAVFAALVIGSGLVPMVATPAHAAGPTVVASIGDLSIVEGDVGTTAVDFPITLSAPAPAQIKVQVVAWNGTATSPADFTAVNSTVTFQAGQVEKNATVKINSDTAVEPQETINVTLGTITGATAGRNWGLIAITDNDANGVSATPEVTAGYPTAQEGNAGDRRTDLPIRLSRPATAAVSVRFWDGCKTKDVTFAKGQLVKNVDVGILPDFAPNASYTIPNGFSIVSGPATVPWGLTGVLVRDDDGTAPAAATTVRASENSRGVSAHYPAPYCGNEVQGRSTDATISANGRYVAFTSNATNLVPNDTNNVADVFVKDVWTGAIERASISSTGAQLKDESFARKISRDGRYVIFSSLDQNTVPGFDVWFEHYIYDRVTRSVSRALDVPSDDGRVRSMDISADSRFIAVDSQLHLVPEADTPCVPDPNVMCYDMDIFVIDRTTGAVTLVTTGEDGRPNNGFGPAMSADGTSVVYAGLRDPLAREFQIFVTDLDTGVTEVVTRNDAGQEMVGGGITPAAPAVSADGQQIAFTARACNLGVSCGSGAAANGYDRVYVRDRNTGTTTVESGTNPAYARLISGVSISDNGRYVTMATTDPTIIPGWTSACDGHVQVLQRDRVAKTWSLVSVTKAGKCSTGEMTITYNNASSADGSFVVFSTDAPNIVDRDSGIDEDVFVRRMR